MNLCPPLQYKASLNDIIGFKFVIHLFFYLLRIVKVRQHILFELHWLTRKTEM